MPSLTSVELLYPSRAKSRRSRRLFSMANYFFVRYYDASLAISSFTVQRQKRTASTCAALGPDTRYTLQWAERYPRCEGSILKVSSHPL